MDKIMKDVLELEDDDLEGIRRIDDLINLKEADIDILTAPDTSGSRIAVPLSQKNLVKILKEWKFFLMNQYSLKRIDWDDPSIVNQDSFDDFCVSTYDPDTSLRNQFAQMTFGIPSSGVLPNES